MPHYSLLPMRQGDEAHIHIYEQGGASSLGGAHARALTTREDGTMDLAKIEAAIRGDDPHFPVTKVVCLEQTHNRAGGRVLPLDYIDAVGALAHERGVALHIDGARIMNACTAAGVAPARMVQAADTVSVCLSKGLAAPLGSLVLGSADFIRRARRVRKALGGGMRQVGVVAAPALLALTEMSKRLHEDHDRAKCVACARVRVACCGRTCGVLHACRGGCAAPCGARCAGWPAHAWWSGWCRCADNPFTGAACIASAWCCIACPWVACARGRCRALGEGLNGVPGVSVDITKVESNIVMLHVDADATGLTAPDLSSALKAHRVLCSAKDASTIRLVTHYQVTDEGVAAAIAAVAACVAAAKPAS